MSAREKKRKVDAECRVFNKDWTAKYLFTEVGRKAVCLVCGEKIAVMKDYNLNRHFDAKHGRKYRNLSDAERARKAEDMLSNLEKQQGLFTKLHASRDATAKTSLILCYKIFRW